ncbi:MAG: NRDE family protein [Dokdonella sp.]
MCLLLIAVDPTPAVPLLLLGNRDEFHARASAPARTWSDDTRVVGGRDLVAGGTWLALRNDGRFAAVTNLRTGVPATAPRSRGCLVRDFVLGDAAPRDYLESLRATASDYGPFNLVVGDEAGVFALGSSDRVVRALGIGVHVISNGPIGVHWPKTERLQRRFEALLAGTQSLPDETQLLDLLLDETQPPDAALPDTGVGRALERVLAPIFIRGAKYGTRATTLVMRSAHASQLLRERRFAPAAVVEGEARWVGTRDQEFQGEST